MNAAHPIGVFDSGIGGLSIVNALQQQLPGEDIIYFGDNVHFPYGEKSAQTLQHYVHTISDMLFKQNCKLILIACNSASAAIAQLQDTYIEQRALCVEVITPMVNHIAQHYPNGRIGLIGTRQTIQSNCYQQHLLALQQQLEITCQATPLLAPLVEEGFANAPWVQAVLASYLDNPNMQNLDALILGCTHYPLLREQLQRYYEQQVDILDGSRIVAHAVKQKLQQHECLNSQTQGKTAFYVAEATPALRKAARFFINNEVELTTLPLWD